MDHIDDVPAWLRLHFNAKSRAEAADRIGVEAGKLTRWLNGPEAAHVVIELARAYGFSTVERLVAVGLLTKEEMDLAHLPPSPGIQETTFSEFFREWTTTSAHLLDIEFEHARRIGATQPHEARSDLWNVFEELRETGHLRDSWELYADREIQPDADGITRGVSYHSKARGRVSGRGRRRHMESVGIEGHEPPMDAAASTTGQESEKQRMAREQDEDAESQ
jgi:hypothetical protein